MKTEIRGGILDRRNQLQKADILEKSSDIAESLFRLEQYKNAKSVMLFASFGNEVGTHEIIRKSLANKTVLLPKVESHEIEPSLILDFDSLVPSGKWGILEPIELMKVAYKNIDLVLVPGIAFDRRGFRLGFGFGYYDKFLKKVPKAVKIGLAFDFQVVDKIPKEEHDVPVDFIITEKRVIECGR